MHGRPPTREDAARIELGNTDVRPGVAWALLLCFAVTLMLPASVQGIATWLANRTATTVLALSTSRSLSALSTPGGSQATPAVTDLLNRIPTTQQLRRFEDRLADSSRVARALTPWVSCGLKGWLHGGDEQVYFGREGWLFYRPGVDSVTGPGFLTAIWQQRRLRDSDPASPPPQPDPTTALLEFREQLAERGITLVVVPVPGKESIYPEMLVRGLAGKAPLRNSSFDRFKARLSQAGVLVFDPAPILTELKGSARAYLMTDTHWSPVAMERTASELAAWLDERNLLLPVNPSLPKRETVQVQNLGDITAMLALPDEQTFFPRESASITRVLAADGNPWQPDEQAAVLLLGDSFSNIYSLGAMGWGDSAGFAEHLSAALERPVDRLAINAGGASSSRQELARELVSGRDRLAGKRVLVYEFAARELAVGDWKLIALPKSAPAAAAVTAGSRDGVLVRGRVAAVGRLPRPGSVPYKDCLLALHLTAVQGLPPGGDDGGLLVYAMGMKDNQWQPVASLKPGGEVQFRLRDWSDVEARFGTFNRSELDDLNLLALPAYWADEVIP